MPALPILRFRAVPADVHVLVLACALAGVGSIFAGQDANWDLLNYHLYNPWAWLNGRYGYDLAPAQLQTFHNPTGDLPFYAMVAADWPPRVIAFVMALPAGIAAFFLWKIARILLRHLDSWLRNIAILAALAIGLSGVNGIAMLGSTMNEWPGTALLLAALWLLLRDLDGETLQLRTLAAAGFLVGLACGLKLTAATFAVGMAVALVATRLFAGALRSGVAFALCVIAGLAITAGAWMALLQDLYGSPLFPYFNQVFASPLLPPEMMVERRFGPKTWQQWLRLPFDLFRPPASYVSEVRYRDARIPAIASLALIALCVAAFRRDRERYTAGESSPGPTWRFVTTFLVASFIVWALLHSIYRYLLPLETLSGVAIVALVARLVPLRARVATVIALAVLIIATTRYPDWGRTAFGEHFLAVAPPPIEANALVVLTADAPMSWVLTRFPDDTRHVGIESNLIRSHQHTGFRAKAAAIVASHAGPIYQLTVTDLPAERELASYGLARIEGGCAEVRGNLSKHPLALCRLARVAG